jgi:starch phosphorylase
MPFQIQPLNEFLVRPALPARIVRLGELAYNLVWSWDHSIRALFRRLDPVLWKQSNHNPVWLLSCVPQQTLEKAAADPRFLALYDRAMSRYDEYLKRHEPTEQPAQIAYFSMEYGLIDCMPIYSGGLGVLSGDHLKASSDAAIPLVGVGLLYQKGYLQQSLNPDGWQQERNPVNDFYSLPVRPVQREDGSELLVSVDLPRGRVQIKVWQITVGTVRLFLLDTNIPENQALGEYRDITDHLYGGDATTRPAGDRRQTDSVPHERGTLGLPRHRTHPNPDARSEPHVRGSARSHAPQQRFHDAYQRSRRHRPLRHGAALRILPRLLRTGGHSV